MKQQKDLSRRERQLLDALYRLGKATAAEVRDVLKDPPSYSAVRAHLANLETKGYVRFESDGVRYIFEPTVPWEQMATEAMSGVLQNFFDNRLELAVSTLLRQKETKISQEDLELLAGIIERARKEGR